MKVDGNGRLMYLFPEFSLFKIFNNMSIPKTWEDHHTNIFYLSVY